MQSSREDSFNVMSLSVIISLTIILLSFIGLWFLTKDSYLNFYFLLESFFNVQNTAASTDLAALVFSGSNSLLLPTLAIVIVDNISRVLVVSFIIAAVIDFLNYADVERIINYIKAGRLRNHVILCGHNELTDRFISRLREQHIRYVVIVPEKEKELMLNESRVLNIVGDFADSEVLDAASIARANAIAFVSEKDVDNVAGCLVARRLNPKIKIMSRIGDESIRKKVYGIGADMAVIPEHLAGMEMGDYVAKLYGG